jgi:dTDP-4-amino-4,6-dideoxygalactose transaminase
LNARLDTLQAAILLPKLAVLDDEVRLRGAVAARYTEALAGVCEVPRVPDGRVSAWAQYTIRVPDRARVRERLAARGVPTQVYYAKGLHEQPAYAGSPVAPGGLPEVERAAGEVLSLPIGPYLDADDQGRVVEALVDALAPSR